MHFLFNTGTRRAEKKMAEFVLEADSWQRLQTAQLHFSKWIRKCFSAPSEFKGSVIHADRDHHDINQLGSQNVQKLWDTFVICSLMWYFLKCTVYCLAFLYVGTWEIDLCSQPGNNKDTCPMDAFCSVL